MNILFVATRAFSMNRGGIERFSLELGNRFVHDGLCAFYLSLVNDLSFQDIMDCESDKAHYFLPNDHQIACDQNKEYVCQLAEKLHIDVIINNQSDTIGWIDLCEGVCSRLGTKLVSILHFDPYHYHRLFKASFRSIVRSGLPVSEQIGLMFRNSGFYQNRQRRLFGRIYARAINKSDAFVVLSPKARPRLLKMVKAADSSKIVSISNPVTVEEVVADRSTKRNQLLFVGRMEFAAKRPDLLLDIWERIYREFPDWELIMIGSGSYLPVVRRIARQRGLERITFTGSVNSSDYYKSASILCVTSNTEGFSLVTVEASHNYVVPIAFDSFAAVSDVIKHGETGYIVPAFDIDEYCALLRQLMTHPAQLQQMADNAHRYVQRFSMDRIVTQWYELFDSLQA